MRVARPGPSTHPLLLNEVSALPPQYHFPSCDLGEASAGPQLQGVHSSSAHLAHPSADVAGGCSGSLSWRSPRSSL